MMQAIHRIEIREAVHTELNTRWNDDGYTFRVPVVDYIAVGAVLEELPHRVESLSDRIFEWRKVCYPKWISVKREEVGGVMHDHGYWHRVYVWHLVEEGSLS